MNPRVHAVVLAALVAFLLVLTAGPASAQAHHGRARSGAAGARLHRGADPGHAR